MLFSSTILSALALFATAQSVAALPAKPFPMVRMESGESAVAAERDIGSVIPAYSQRASAKFSRRFSGSGKKRLSSEDERDVARIPDSVATSADAEGNLHIFGSKRLSSEEERDVARIPDSVATSADAEGNLHIFGSKRTPEVARNIATSSDNGVLSVFSGGAARAVGEEGAVIKRVVPEGYVHESERSINEDVVTEKRTSEFTRNIATSSDNGVLSVFSGGAARAVGEEGAVIKRVVPEGYVHESEMVEKRSTKSQIFGDSGKLSRNASSAPKRRLAKESDDELL